MSIIVLPTAVRVPTRLDDLTAKYVDGKIDLDEFEIGAARLLADGTADDVSFYHGMGTSREWR
jgi:hypothetical protein